MTMKPYIFLSENYLQYAQDSNGNNIDVRVISASVPYTVEVFFTDRYGNATNRTIDTLILNNTNIKNMTVQYMTGGGTYSNLLSLSSNTYSTVILKAATPALTSSILITVPDDTFNPADLTGTMGIYSFVCNLFALTDSSYKIEANEGGYRTVDGSYIHFADYKKWVGKVQMENVTKAQFDLLTAQADTGEITVVPYKDLEADAVYECAVKREYQFEVDRKTKLFKLTLELNEL